MQDESKVPINAKIPFKLHLQLLEAVNRKEYSDKTDCIIKALDVLLNNTRQETEDNTTVIQERDLEIQVLRSEIQNNLSKINELQAVIHGIPDPQEIADLRARNNVIQELLNEKDKLIEALENNLRDLRVLTYKQGTQDSNTAIIPRNTQAAGLIQKVCKQCGNTFFTGNVRKETCGQKCRSAFSKKTRRK